LLHSEELLQPLDLKEKQNKKKEDAPDGY